MTTARLTIKALEQAVIACLGIEDHQIHKITITFEANCVPVVEIVEYRFDDVDAAELPPVLRRFHLAPIDG